MSKYPDFDFSVCGTFVPADVSGPVGDLRNKRNLNPPDRFHAEAVHLKGTRWEKRVLTVAFQSGSPAFRQRVAATASAWMSFANIQFQFTTQPGGDIRVSLVQNGINRSEVGNRAATVPAGQPTMMLGRLNENAPDFEFQNIVLHEFGHALGLVHEHQSPNHIIQWKRQRVIDDCMILFGWTPPMVEAEILRPFETAAVTATPFDQASIMNYAIPDSWTENGVVVPRPSALSAQDRAFISNLYP